MANTSDTSPSAAALKRILIEHEERLEEVQRLLLKAEMDPKANPMLTKHNLSAIRATLTRDTGIPLNQGLLLTNTKALIEAIMASVWDRAYQVGITARAVAACPDKYD